MIDIKNSTIDIVSLVKVALSAIIFVLIAYRAYSSGITYGEAYTYLYYVVEPLAGPWDRLLIFSNGNNHLLNTFLVKAVHKLGPFNEWLIRLPNVLAFVAFVTAAILLTKTRENKLFSLAIFMALVLSVRHTEFFGLARGYGLGLALGLWGILFFSKALKTSFEKTLRFIAPGSFCIALATWSNFSFLYLAAALPLAFLVTRTDSARELFVAVFSSWRGNKGSCVLIAGSFVLIILAAMAASQINFPTAEFNYFWDAIFPDQIQGVLQVFLLFGLERTEAVKALLLIWVALYLLAVRRNLFFSNLFLILTLLSCFVPWLVQQQMMTGRTTLYFYPVIVLSLGELSWNFFGSKSKTSFRFIKSVSLILICVYSAVNFFSQFSLDRTRHVRWDYGYRAAVEQYREHLATAYQSGSKPILCMRDHPSVHFYVHKASLYKFPFTVSARPEGFCGARYIHPDEEIKISNEDLVQELPWGRLVIYVN